MDNIVNQVIMKVFMKAARLWKFHMDLVLKVRLILVIRQMT